MMGNRNNAKMRLTLSIWLCFLGCCKTTDASFSTGCWLSENKALDDSLLPSSTAAFLSFDTGFVLAAGRFTVGFSRLLFFKRAVHARMLARSSPPLLLDQGTSFLLPDRKAGDWRSSSMWVFFMMGNRNNAKMRLTLSIWLCFLGCCKTTDASFSTGCWLSENKALDDSLLPSSTAAFLSFDTGFVLAAGRFTVGFSRLLFFKRAVHARMLARSSPPLLLDQGTSFLLPDRKAGDWRSGALVGMVERAVWFGWVGRTSSLIEEERRDVWVVVGIAPAFAMELATNGSPETMVPPFGAAGCTAPVAQVSFIARKVDKNGRDFNANNSSKKSEHKQRTERFIGALRTVDRRDLHRPSVDHAWLKLIGFMCMC